MAYPINHTLKAGGRSQGSHAWYIMRENPLTAFAFAMFACIVVVALSGPLLAPYDPLMSNTANALSPPSADHWFGTDQLGRDVFSRVLVE